MEVAVVADRADDVADLVHPIASRVDVPASRIGVGPEHDAPLDVRGDPGAGHGEHGRREVGEAHELVPHLARRETAGPAHHEGNAKTRIVGPALGPRQAVAVVGGEDDEGVVHEAVLLELREQATDLPVHERDVVVVAGDVGAHDRRVGVIGGTSTSEGSVTGSRLARSTRFFARMRSSRASRGGRSIGQMLLSCVASRVT